MSFELCAVYTRKFFEFSIYFHQAVYDVIGMEITKPSGFNLIVEIFERLAKTADRHFPDQGNIRHRTSKFTKMGFGRSIKYIWLFFSIYFILVHQWQSDTWI